MISIDTESYPIPMNHLAEAKRVLELCPWNETTALAHAVVAFTEILSELPVVGFQVFEILEDEDEEEEV